MYYVVWLISLFLFSPCLADDKDSKEMILSTPDQLAHQDSLVGKLVGPLGGQLVLQQTDLHIAGAEPLSLTRAHVPPSIKSAYFHDGGDGERHHLNVHLHDTYRGWIFFPQMKLQYFHAGFYRVTDDRGVTLDYRIHNDQTYLLSDSAGITNYAGGTPGGQHDPRNTRITRQGTKVIVTAPDGTIRTYRPGWFVFILEKEQLPNGKVRHFTSLGDSAGFVSVKTLDPSEQHTYATLSFSGFVGLDRTFSSSTGQESVYSYEMRPATNKFEISKRFRPRFENDSPPPLLTSVKRPGLAPEVITYSGRCLLDSYRSKNVLCRCDYAYANHGYATVHALSLPVGNEGAITPVYRLKYDMPVANRRGGITTVDQVDGTRVVYHYSSRFLPEKIAFYDANKELVKQTHYHWNAEQRLSTLEWTDKGGEPICRKSYAYDRFGNPTLEILTGDLTGNGGTESCVTRRAFSDDGRQLLLREETEAGKVVTFQYVPDTNLPTAKLTYDRDRLVKREFWRYDGYLNLIQAIVDDGVGSDSADLSGITTRTLTTYQLRTQQPFLHMPEWTEEAYWEAGHVHTLKRTQYIYDQYGNVCRDDIYDAEGVRAYSLHRYYNAAGQKLHESNALDKPRYTIMTIKVAALHLGKPRAVSVKTGAMTL